MHKVRTCLWYDGDALEAAQFYVSLLPDSRILSTSGQAPGGAPLVIEFLLGGTPYQAINGGPTYRLNEAASISVITRDQEETDRLWTALTSSGGRPSRCAWLVDPFGLSWQIVPEVLTRYLADPDRAAADRVMRAMLGMSKIVIAEIEAAYRG